MKRLLLVFLFCLFFTGCQVVEPEEVFLVSAVAFDRTGSNFKISAEVPLARREGSDSTQTQVFTGTGKTFFAAMEDLKSQLAKRLDFGHCALVVLGEEIEGETLSAVWEAVEAWNLPLSVTVVCTPCASGLLQGGKTGTPVGYEIPDILQILAKERQSPFFCRYYELVSANGNFELPVILSEKENGEDVNRFLGMRAYQNGRAVRV